MLINDFEFVRLYVRDIGRLKDELRAFDSEKDLWRVSGDMKNSAGNLTLHLIGNLNHFFGAVLGNTGYVRERDKEFSEKNVPREQLLLELEKTEHVVVSVLQSLSDEDAQREFPLPFFGEGAKTAFVLGNLLAHFNYHLGQVNALRRML